ncbi:DUF547 domain-containing protein [Siansivirga zeaxanthinifaciens]|uniref:DUF547 domain-containing protein n=1 Tax=Siansivirga zeaxanthinifaciens CC-SAMT-1 TaxID=1454006 RepID=A0A0C5W8E3_9FLAO|nr:DUF547 domain-containing protein [Siansivirga zeaxanthinifaciens]AJR02547.1 hypothetical protein AW14_01655 [Siansivirga zeaxanthinifaciens CC-SAMT-1]
MKKIKITIVLLFITIAIQAQDINMFFSKADAFFNSHVSNGKVAYDKIIDKPEALNEALKLAKTISVDKSDTKNYQAFWINAYNLSVIKGLIDLYPIKSPLDKPGFFDKITHNLAGVNITLNDIEHKLLRAQFNDARFHFVLVCGAVGCPPLINKAYLPNTLEAQLEGQTKKAINGDFIKVNDKKNRVEVSQIMEWYKEDFTMKGKDEIDFINKYRTEKLEGKWKVSYFPYNWTINKQ